MPYGTMSNETTIRLRESGLEDAYRIEPHNDTVTIDIVCFGALDESFEIKAGYEKQVVDALVPMFEGNGEIDDWEIAAYIPEQDTLYVRRSS